MACRVHVIRGPCEKDRARRSMPMGQTSRRSILYHRRDRPDARGQEIVFQLCRLPRVVVYGDRECNRRHARHEGMRRSVCRARGWHEGRQERRESGAIATGLAGGYGQGIASSVRACLRAWKLWVGATDWCDRGVDGPCPRVAIAVTSSAQGVDGKNSPIATGRAEAIEIDSEDGSDAATISRFTPGLETAGVTAAAYRARRRQEISEGFITGRPAWISFQVGAGRLPGSPTKLGEVNHLVAVPAETSSRRIGRVR